MKKFCEYNDDPFFKYTVEELSKLTEDDFCSLLEESNEYVRKKHSQLSEQVPPIFNTVEELMEYYDAIPFEEAVNKMNELFNNNG